MSLFLNCVKNLPVERPPVWFMRQAGRYLSEYRNTRKEAGSFLDLCYNSDLATEVTLQPIEKFGFDAAILFADILLILDALGVKVQFVEGQGPRLEPVRDRIGIQKISNVEKIHDKLFPVYETVKKLKRQLLEQNSQPELHEAEGLVHIEVGLFKLSDIKIDIFKKQIRKT